MISSTDVWAIVKLRLGLKTDDLYPLIDTYILEMERRIKHFCNIAMLPDDLLYTWASMVMDAVRIELPNVDEIEDTVGSGGGNVKVGDTSVSSGGTSGGLSNTSKSIIDSVVLNYKVDLIRYRRLRWN